MTQNEVKTLLSVAAISFRRYKAKSDEADTFRQQLAIKPLSNGGGGTSSKINSTELGYIQLAALEEKQRTLYTEWLQARERVVKAIDMCPLEKERQVLIYRYLNNCRYEDIAEALGYSIDNIFKLHKKAIRYLSNVL